MIKSQLVLIELRENCTDVQMSVSLNLRALEPRFNRKSSLQEVKSSAHFANSTIVACHVVESHSLAKLVVFTKLFRLLQKVQSAVNVLLLEVVDCKDVTDFTELLASACEFARGSSEVHFLHPEELLQDSDGFNIFALHKRH